jgi:arylsulfatase A-like enzyme
MYHIPLATGLRYAGDSDATTIAWQSQSFGNIKIGCSNSPDTMSVCNSNAHPIFIAPPGTPSVTVGKLASDAASLPATVRMPEEAKVNMLQGSGQDATITIFYPDTNRAYVFYKYSWNNGAPTAQRHVDFSVTGTGHPNRVGDGDVGTIAAGVANWLGIMRGHEIAATGQDFNHRFKIAVARKDNQGTHILGRNFHLPANGTDGGIGSGDNLGPFNYGDIVALPTSVDIDSLGLSEPGKRFARAMQQYGVLIADGGPQGIRGDQYIDVAARDLISRDFDAIWDRMRRVEDFTTNAHFDEAVRTGKIGPGTPLGPNCAFDAAGGTGGTGGTTGGTSVVSMPSISPSGGTFTTTQTVTLSTATAGAEIRYTTNGSDPSSSSALYSSPFSLSSSATVKARAFKSGMTESSIASATFTKGGTSSGKPNIIVIMTDDQDVPSLSKMPLVRSLLQNQGTTLTNTFTNFALCCPSRATLITGQQATNHRVQWNDNLTGYNRLNENQTLPVWLKAVGYKTFMNGKYLNEYGDLVHANTYIPPGWDEWHAHPDPDSYKYYNYEVNHNGVVRRYGSATTDYQGDVITQGAVDFIDDQRSSSQPFFMWVNYLAPHVEKDAGGLARAAPRHASRFASEPLPMPPSFNEADVTDKPALVRLTSLSATEIDRIRDTYRSRLASLMAVDEGVEDIVNALQSTGKLSNTYIIYVSDNGNYNGEHRIAREKNSYYQPAIKVPLVIRGPGVPANATKSELVSNIDLAATIVDIADATPGITMDGRSLLPLLTGSPSWRTAMFVDGLGRNAPNGATQTQFDAVRTLRYLYVQHATGEKELYDYVADPHELDNKANASAYSLVQNDLTTKLNTLRTCTGASCWITSAIPTP